MSEKSSDQGVVRVVNAPVASDKKQDDAMHPENFQSLTYVWSS